MFRIPPGAALRAGAAATAPSEPQLQPESCTPRLGAEPVTAPAIHRVERLRSTPLLLHREAVIAVPVPLLGPYQVHAIRCRRLRAGIHPPAAPGGGLVAEPEIDLA